MTAAHTDGYDYADYMADPEAWARRAVLIADSEEEGELFVAAANDYIERVNHAALHGGVLVARGVYLREHVQGQLERAAEILSE